MPFLPASPALQRYRILDLTRVRAGPTCVRQFADFGADVIKIESPPGVDPNENMGGERHGPDFQNLHRNKRSMTLNLKTGEGLAIFMKLVERSDVVVENYRADVKDRLGIDYASLAKVNPRIVLGSISGFGQDGPYADRPGFDQIAQGMGGFMTVTGHPGQGPIRAGTAIADLTAGLWCALGIMTALLERESSGRGQWVQSSLLQSQIALMDFQAARFLMKGEVAPQVGNDHPTSMPTSAYKSKDGYLNIAASGDGMFRRLAAALERPDFLEREEFRTDKGRAKHRALLNAEIDKVTATRTTAEWVELLNRAGVPSGPIYTMDQVFDDPQVRHLEAATTVAHPQLGPIRIVNQAVKLSRTASSMARATPERGEHTEEILRELGYGEADFDRFRNQKVI